MNENNQEQIIVRNFDRLADFLADELASPSVAAQIPDGAHIFHGAAHDSALTAHNLESAAKIRLGMALGYVADAPLMMVFEREDGERVVLNLSTALPSEQAQALIGRFHEQAQDKITVQIAQLPGL